MAEVHTIRKDSEADKTISRIKNMLNEIGLKVIVKLDLNNDLFYSCRIECENLPLGTNGKGVTEELSLASGYAEFMERMQSGCLFSFISQGDEYKFVDTQATTPDALINQVGKHFSPIYDVADNSVFDKLFEVAPFMLNQREYYNVLKKSIEFLPEGFIQYLCGSNGLCAGNTPEEAISQGLAELYERISIKNVYYNGYEAAVIPESAYINLPSMQLISRLKKKIFYVMY